MRLNQYIAESGMCSRREADKHIENGEVKINGKVAVLGTQVNDGDSVLVNGKVVNKESDRVVLLLNKPLGVTSTTNKFDKSNIIDFVNYPKRLFTIGRLDKNSEGAILLTNDGSLVNSLLRSENGHEKTYVVYVNKTITAGFIASMSSGVKIFNPVLNADVTTKPCKIKQLSNKSFEIILTQGFNRQIRRMCEAHDYKVTSLTRTKFMFLTLNTLKVGEWRFLTNKELAQLDKMKIDKKKDI